MNSSKAGEISQELLDTILGHASFRSRPRIQPLERKELRGLFVCARVCRYWANTARNEAFRMASLGSLEDIKRLCTVIEAATTPTTLIPIADIVYGIHAIVDGRGLPWVHLIFFDLLPKLRSNTNLLVELVSASGRPWRTLHPSLPRPLAGSLMPIKTLIIIGTHFPSGRSLAQLLSSMPRLAELYTTNISFDTEPTSGDFLALPYGLRLHSVIADNIAIPMAMLPRLFRNSTSDGPADRPGRVARYDLAASEMEVLCELLSLFSSPPSHQFQLTRRYTAARYYGQMSVPMQSYICFDKRDKDPNYLMKFQPTAPSLVIALQDSSMNEPRPPSADIDKSQEKPTPLEVWSIRIDLGEAPHRAFELCGVQLWSRFAALTLKFAGLRRVQLVSLSPRHETQLGTFNSALRPLIQAGKLQFVAADADIRAYGLSHAAIESRLPGPERQYEVDDLPGDVRGVFLKKIVPRMIQKMGTLNAFMDPDLTQIQQMLDELAEYRYHWQLWQDRAICVRLVEVPLREWQLGFGATALQGMKILADHVTMTLRGRKLDDDAVKLALSGKIKELLGGTNDKDRPFWWYEPMAGKGKLFGSALIQYTFSNHVRPLGGYIPGIWVPPEGALILSVLAAERALQAYSTGILVEPRVFSALNSMDGWHYVERDDFEENRHITRIAHLQKVIRAMPLVHWKPCVGCASAMRKQMDEMQPGEAPRQLGKDEGLPLGVPWDEPLVVS